MPKLRSTCKDCGVPVVLPRDGRCDVCIAKAYTLPNSKNQRGIVGSGEDVSSRLPDDIDKLATVYAEEMHKPYKARGFDEEICKLCANLDFKIVFGWA